jgi:hypothetical protein
LSTSPLPLSGLAYPYGQNNSGSGLDLEPVGGPTFGGAGATSLTNYIASIQNLTGGQGQGVLGSGAGTFGEGLGLVAPGLAQANSGATAAAPALQYLTSLVKGDQADLTQAAQPEIDQVSQQFDAVRNLISQQPRGGGKASVLAEAPFQKATAVGNIEAGLQSGAAGQLGGLATQLAGIGLGEAGVGTTEAGLGLGQEQIGEGLESLSSDIALTKQGLNYGQPSALAQTESAVDTFI